MYASMYIHASPTFRPHDDMPISCGTAAESAPSILHDVPAARLAGATACWTATSRTIEEGTAKLSLATPYQAREDPENSTPVEEHRNGRQENRVPYREDGEADASDDASKQRQRRRRPPPTHLANHYPEVKGNDSSTQQS